MEEYNLHDFIPLYNQIQTNEFNKDINHLLEFTQYKLPKEEPFPQHPGDLMLHQKFISNFISPNTLYNELLLVHEMGTGKTCTAVSVAEKFIQEKVNQNIKFPNTILKNIIVLTKGKGLQNNFINEIAHVCTVGNYLSNDLLVKSSIQDKRVRKNVKVNYTFETFEIFTKNLKNKSNGEKHSLYENTLFIVDEAHNLRMSSDPEERNIYREIYGLFHLLKSRKILLLTGTPMKDKPEEIIDLLNLILKDKLTIEDLQNEKVFKSKINGYVSYLRAMTSDIDRIEVGQLIGKLKHFKIYPVIMDKFQANLYMSAKLKDEEERSIFNYSRQASSLVFPDQTYGKNGFETNIVKTGSGYKFVNMALQQEMKNNLRLYSAKYADLIERLNDDFSKGKLSFVFSEFVKGSGLLVLSLLLELNGYVNATVNSNFVKPQKRFVIFTNETSTDTQTRRLINIFNSSKNKNGRYISTILGSRVIMEGFTFKNIQSEYILTPHWNYSETSQIIARGLRLGSHNDLIKDGTLDIRIDIYQYVALPSSDESKFEESIDLHMYQIAEVKDFENQKIIRYLKEAALDCALNKDRNTVLNSNLNFTRSCEYTNCMFKCDNNLNEDQAEDRRNYKLLYFKFSKDYFLIKNFIIEMVKLSPLTIEKIQTSLNSTTFEILNVIEDLLNFQEILFVRPEGSYYLTENKNIFYAYCHSVENSNPNNEEDPYLLNFYSRNVTIFDGKSLDELIYIHQEDFMIKLVDKVFKSQNLQQLQIIIVKLPLYLQEKLLCICISLRNKDTRNNFVRDMVLNNYRLYYKIKENYAFVWLNAESYKCTFNTNDINEWRKCTFKEVQKIENMKKEREKVKIVGNPYGYIGLLNRITNDFCLKKIDAVTEEDKRRKFVGKRCQNWKKQDLIDLISNKLKVDPDNENFDFDESDMEMMKQNPKFKNILKLDGTLKDYKRIAFWNVQDMNYICTKIMQDLKDKNLVVDDPNCGTSKKIR
jgi:superfamily II DNA or RNA helicase